MGRQVVLVHWDDTERASLAAELEGWGHRVATLDEARGLKLRDPPEERPLAVVISLRRLPSHGREVADALWHPKWAREALRIVFVDGTPEARAKTAERFPTASFADWAELRGLLSELAVALPA
jgi:hypothetical protein